jgi:hypothetical protein
MACREEKSIAIDPTGILRVITEGLTEQGRSNFCGSKRQAKVPG